MPTARATPPKTLPPQKQQSNSQEKPSEKPSETNLPAVLAEVDFQSIEALIDKDPKTLSNKDLTLIVSYTRAHREAWMQEENNPSGPGGGKKRKLKVDLDSLDLDL